MKYALIGCGRVSTNHIKAAVTNSLEIVAVCDIVPEHMENVLEKHGLPFEAMLPLIDEAARKVHRMSPPEAQTGPARRGDANVMNAHKMMLDDELANIYETLSDYIMRRYDKQ